MTTTEITLNPIEERLFEHWGDTIRYVTTRSLHVDEIKRIEKDVEAELSLFLDVILPIDYPLCDWAFWSDGVQFFSRSEYWAERLAETIHFFMGGGYTVHYTPEEDKITADHSGYWAVVWGD